MTAKRKRRRGKPGLALLYLARALGRLAARINNIARHLVDRATEGDRRW